MLQQTQVASVIDYYQRWMKRFPDIYRLARASEDQVLHAWQGLGYYSRARRLREGARFLVERHGNRLPRTPEEWLEVPGVGRYTAGAVTSIAFGAVAPVVDGNVTRVLCRVHGLAGNPTKAPLGRELWLRAEELLVPSHPGDVNQALMELGATVCTPKRPRCAECPWRRRCRAHQSDQVERYPEMPERRAATPVSMACAVVQQRGRVLLVKQPADATRWASMWLFPNIEVTSEADAPEALRRALEASLRLQVQVSARLGTYRHAVTRYRIALHVHECRIAKRLGPTTTRTVWARKTDLAAYALPAVHRRIANDL